MTNLFLMSPGAIVGISLVSAVILMAGVFGLTFGVLVPHRNRMIKLKQEQKLERARTKADIEILKKKADFEIEKEKEQLRPRFCKYCGTQHTSGQSNCTNCGSSLK